MQVQNSARANIVSFAVLDKPESFINFNDLYIVHYLYNNYRNSCAKPVQPISKLDALTRQHPMLKECNKLQKYWTKLKKREYLALD
jgi:hypothetical protein